MKPVLRPVTRLRQRLPIGALMALLLIFALTLVGFFVVSRNLEPVFDFTSTQATGFAYAEFQRQIAVVQLAVAEGQSAQSVQNELDILHSKAEIIRNETYYQKIPAENRGLLESAVQSSLALSLKDLQNNNAKAQLEKILLGAQDGFRNVVFTIGEERENLRKNLLTLEYALIALVSLLGVSMAIAVLQFSRTLRLELKRSDELQAAQEHLLALTTNLRVSEAAAEHQRDLALNVMNTMGQGLTITNAAGRFEFVNPAYAKLVGETAQALIGRSPLEFAFPEELSKLEQVRLEREAGTTTTYATVLKRTDGLPCDVLITGVPRLIQGQQVGSVAVITDLTQTKAAEKRLFERTTQLLSVISVSPDGVLICSPEGSILEYNAAFLDLTNLQAQDLENASETMVDRWLLTRCDPKAPYVFGVDAQEEQLDLIRLKFPTLRVLRRYMRLMRDENQQIIGKVMYFRDITHESEVDRLKTEFLSTAAHELRTPMASIYGFSELIATRDFDSETTKSMAKTVYRQAGRLVGILNDLLDLTRIEARAGKDFKIVPHDLAELIEITAEAFVPLAESERFVMDLPTSLPSISLDADKFQQALGNVISNAFKYSPNGGVVELGVVFKAERCGIWVRDQGIGLTPEQLARVFERFYRADTSGTIVGTGLGLALVKEIVELHGGRVEIDSEFGVGTTVTLWFLTREV